MLTDYSSMRARQAATIEAMGNKEGRLLNDIEQQIGKCLTWPTRFTDMFLSTHLLFPQRWQLTLFILANRCPPSLMVKWYLLRGMLHDKSARDQVADLIKQHKNGTLERQGRTTWVMGATQDKPAIIRKHKWDGVGDPALAKNQVISTPSFAFDYLHEWHWDEAIKTLKMPPPFVPPNTPEKKRKRVDNKSPEVRSDKVELLNRWEAEKRS